MNNFTYFCGVDVSKNSFVVSIKNSKPLINNETFAMAKCGFEEFEKILKNFGKENTLIGMEPTGIYHNNLLNFLKERHYNTMVVNPYMLHQFFKFTTNKPTKTDRKDSKTIAEFLEFKQNEFKNTLKISDDKFSIRYLVREKERITQDIASTKTEIRRILSLVFPEVERFSGIFRKDFLSILLEFGGAEKMRRIPEEIFIKHLKQIFDKGRGRKPNLSPEKIYKLACSSIAGNFPDYEEILKIKITKLKNLIEEKQYISNLIEQKAETFFKNQIEILCSIPGIGKESAIHLMAELVDIKRFNHYRKLIGFCGLDPVIKQSGKFRAKWKISKKGNSHARRILWIMACCVIRNCPFFREYYLKKRAEAKSYKEAVIATSTKLLRVIFALLIENRCFK